MIEPSYGCECTDCRVHTVLDYNAKKAPIMRFVNRDGKDIKLCSRCSLKEDKLIRTYIEEDTNVKPFFEYDPVCAGSPEFENHKELRKMVFANLDIVKKAMKKDTAEMGLPLSDDDIDKMFEGYKL